MGVSKDENISCILKTEENNDGLHSNSINLKTTALSPGLFLV